MVSVKQIAVALALAVAVPAVASGAGTSPKPNGVVEGLTGYAVLEFESPRPQDAYPPLLGYVPCDVVFFGFYEVRVPEEWRPTFCNEGSTLYITSSAAPDPRQYPLSPTGNSVAPGVGGYTFPPVEEYTYRDELGLVWYVYRAETFGSAMRDPATGREFNFVGTVNLAKMTGQPGIRAWMIE